MILKDFTAVYDNPNHTIKLDGCEMDIDHPLVTYCGDLEVISILVDKDSTNVILMYPDEERVIKPKSLFSNKNIIDSLNDNGTIDESELTP